MPSKEAPLSPRTDNNRQNSRLEQRSDGTESSNSAGSVGPVPKAPLIALPEPDLQLSQDSEWCLVKRGTEWRQIRFHDYHEIYKIPGLYEKIFYRVLKCDSPAEIRLQLQAELEKHGVDPLTMRALDVGAGNGMVAEQLTQMKIPFIVGIDIIPEARSAALRDRPTAYDHYYVLDLTDLDTQENEQLQEHRFNCMTCVAALGFGDIPAAAFSQAVALVEPAGWLAFNIKAEFLKKGEKSEFSNLISRAVESGAIEILSQRRYVHRLATDGQPLEYVAIIARKRGELSEFLPSAKPVR